MSGVSIPQGMQGMWGGTGAPAGFGGGNSANTVQAVQGADNALTAYDPTKMAGTTPAPAPPEAPKFAAVGMDTTGLPSYVTNWLAQGGTGSVPTQSNMDKTPLGMGQTAEGIAAGKNAIHGGKGFAGDDDAAWIKSHGKEIAAANAADAARNAPKVQTQQPAANSGITPVNMNWVNDPKNLAVADVYNSSQGVSAPGVVQQQGTYNPIQAFIQPNGMMPQFYQDGKGGVYADAAGTKPLDAQTIAYMRQTGIIK